MRVLADDERHGTPFLARLYLAPSREEFSDWGVTHAVREAKIEYPRAAPVACGTQR